MKTILAILFLVAAPVVAAADDVWRAPARVSAPIVVPLTAPERAPDAAQVSSVSPEPVLVEQDQGPVFTSRTLIRASDRRFGFTTFNNLRRGCQRVIGVCRRALGAGAGHQR